VQVLADAVRAAYQNFYRRSQKITYLMAPYILLRLLFTSYYKSAKQFTNVNIIIYLRQQHVFTCIANIVNLVYLIGGKNNHFIILFIIMLYDK
jgi:hypothetical protein